MKFATRGSKSRGTAAPEEPPAKKQKVEQPAKKKPEPPKKQTKNAPKKGKADKKPEMIENDVESKVDNPTKSETEAATSKEDKSKNDKSDGTTIKVSKAKAVTKSNPKPETKKAAKPAESSKGKKTPPAKKSTPKRAAAKKASVKSTSPTPEKKTPVSEKKGPSSKEKAPAPEKKTPAPQKKAPPVKPAAASKTTAPKSARQAAQKRKSEPAIKKAPVKKAKKGENEAQPAQATVVEETAHGSATGESHLESSPVIATQKVVVESNVALQAGSTVDASIGNVVPSVAPVDLLPIQNVLESSPQRLSKLIMQPSQELPAEIFQNEQIVTVTSPQKSPKILKLIIGPRSPDVGHTQGFSPTSGPAVIVRQNTSADVGNPDQITCLNVLNSSPRRSMGQNENDSSGGDTTPSVSDAKSSPPHSIAGTFIPSSPGRYSMVGEGLHNYCKSPLLAPYDLTPPNKLGKSTLLQHKTSTTQQKSSAVQQKSVTGQQKSTSTQRKSSTGEQSTEKKATAKASASTKTKSPKRQQSSSTQATAVTAGPSGTRRSSRGTAGVPPKRDSMVEIPIVNRRRSSSTTAS